MLGCGDDTNKDRDAQQKEPIPASLRTVESASEDIIDLALDGERPEVVRRARQLDSAARAQGAAALATRAKRVAQLAPTAPLLDVALASNRVFALVPALFSRYDTPVPAAVTELDYLDFEAKLESRAGDRPKLARAVQGLRATWDSVRSQVDDAEAVAKFDAHVAAMGRLAANANPDKTQREAQHGLDLVDELEQSFES